MFRLFVLVAGAALLSGADKPYPLLKIQVEGNSRFTPEAVIQGSQLKLGQEVTVAEFAAACQRLSGTGLFTATRFRYRPSQDAGTSGFELTLIVEEEQDLHAVRIEIPEIDEAAAWSWLAQNEPLVTRQIVPNDAATAYYTAAIERFLAGQGKNTTIVARLRTEPTGELVTLFRPAELPKIAAVRFEGAKAVPAAALESTIARLAIGTEYTEASFRELLTYNARKLYEDQGRLGVRFPRVRIDKAGTGDVAVTATVDEGPVYHVGNIEIVGDRLPLDHLKQVVDLKAGDVANWQKVTLNAEKIRTALGREGYLDASTSVEPHLDEAHAAAGISLLVEKGPQSRFGALKLDGLDAASATRARAWWKLAPGAVLNTERVDEFEATLMRDKDIRFRRIKRRYEPGAAGTVDVVFTFR